MFSIKAKTTKLYVILAMLLLTAGCGETATNTGTPQITSQTTSPSVGQETKTIIDWEDFLKLNGRSYKHSQHAALTDPSKLGEEIGKVTFQVANQVNDLNYTLKDGDAAFLPIGTVVHAIKDYPNHEIVAVQDDHAIRGYKLYVEDDKMNKLGLTFEEATQNKIMKIAFYPMNGQGQPVVELKGGNNQAFLVRLLQHASQTQNADIERDVTNPIYYSFVIETGAAIGYVDTIYRILNKYYWNHPEAKELPSAFAYYFANERDVVFTIQGMKFPLPNHTDTVATGERIKRDGSINNITLISADGMTERSLFTQEAIDQLWKKAKEINPSDGENKAYLFMAVRAMPVSNGQLIAYETNKDTVVKQTGGAFNLRLINLDGKEDRIIVDGSKYGGNVKLLDSVGDRIVAEGADYSLLDINISNGKIRHFPINGTLDALSIDGKYVLYRKMVSNALVGTEIAAFDLDTMKTIELGNIPKNYVFSQGVK